MEVDHLVQYLVEDSLEMEEEEIANSSGDDICLVCGRQSNTGFHYGVKSCLGCKTFFRRVVLKGIQPKCKFANKCKLEKGINQKRLCRSCRYLRCKDIGMNEQALHPCRDLIGRRKPSHSSESHSEELSPGGESYGSGSSSTLKPIYDEEASDFISTLRDLDVEIRKRIAECYGQHAVGNVEDYYHTPTMNDLWSVISLNEDVASSLKLELLLIKEWIDRLPGIETLPQHILEPLTPQFCLKFTILEHGLLTSRIPLSNAWFYSDLSCFLCDFESVPVEIKKKLTPQIKSDHSLLRPVFQDLYNDVISPLRRIQLRTEEVAALKMIMFCSRGEVSLSPSELSLLSSLRDRVLHGLHQYLQNTGHPNIGERIGEILMLSGTLTMCARRGGEAIHLLHFFSKANFDPLSQRILLAR